jgi:hypothetical protein
LQELEKNVAQEKEEMNNEHAALQLQIEQLLKHEEQLQAKVRVLIRLTVHIDD